MLLNISSFAVSERSLPTFAMPIAGEGRFLSPIYEQSFEQTDGLDMKGDPTGWAILRRDDHDDQLTSDDIRMMFDEFLIEFECMQTSGIVETGIFLNAIEQTVDVVLHIEPLKLLDPKLLFHPLMHFLQQVLLGKLEKWSRLGFQLTFQEMDMILKIVLIFVHIAECAPVKSTDMDRRRRQHLISTKRFLYEVRDQIDEAVLVQDSSSDYPNIHILGLFAIKLLHGYPFYYALGIDEQISDQCELIFSSVAFLRPMRTSTFLVYLKWSSTVSTPKISFERCVFYRITYRLGRFIAIYFSRAGRKSLVSLQLLQLHCINLPTTILCNRSMTNC